MNVLIFPLQTKDLGDIGSNEPGICPSQTFSCPLYSLNTCGNIFMILHIYVEQALMMSHTQECQLLLSYFLIYFPFSVFLQILVFSVT